MNCPKCNNNMDFGVFEISDTVIGFLIFGISYKNLYFISNGNKKKIIESDTEMNGYYCNNCSLSIYEKKKEKNSTNYTCRNCGAYNGHGGNICIGCGKRI